MSAELPEELAAKRDELLRHATTRGLRLRIRRRVAIVATAIAVVVGIGGGAAAVIGSGDHATRVVTSEPDSTIATSTTVAQSTTTAPEETSTSPATDVPTTVFPVDTTPATVTSIPSTGTTVLVCHDSYDPRCGPLTYTSTPVNQPLELSIDHTVSGLTATLHIHASDDAAVDPCMRINWGDGALSNGPDRFGCIAEGLCADLPQRYGPWDPPAPTPESVVLDFPHTYTRSGTFTVAIDADSADPCSPDNQFYASTASATVQLTVDNPAPTSSTAP
jgi:hypothetical protein